MEISKNANEIKLSENMKITIRRNDFDNLGSILEIEALMNLYKDYIINLLFYDYNKILIPANNLILLTSLKHLFFENTLIVFPAPKANNHNENAIHLNMQNNQHWPNVEENYFTLKFLNKEIFYLKILLLNKNSASFNLNKNIKSMNNINKPISTNYGNYSISAYNPFAQEFNIYHIDCFNLSLLDNDFDDKSKNKSLQKLKNENIYNNDISNDKNNNIGNIYSSNLYVKQIEASYSSSSDKKGQISVILEELNRVNLSLIAEKEILENKKKDLKSREETLSALIM